MAYVEWEIKGREFVNCNCAYGCPCQFNALPTHGYCMGVAGFQIDAGYCGVTRLDELRAVWMGQWPGPIHEGHGTMQILIDERANAAQREALRKIFHGEATEDGDHGLGRPSVSAAGMLWPRPAAAAVADAMLKASCWPGSHATDRAKGPRSLRVGRRCV